MSESVCVCDWRGRWATVHSSVDKVIIQTFLRERSRCVIFTLSCHLTAVFSCQNGWHPKPKQQQFMRVKTCQTHIWQNLPSHLRTIWFKLLSSNSTSEKNYTFSRIHEHSTEMSSEEWRKLTPTVSSLNISHSRHCRFTIGQHKPQLGRALIHLPVLLTDCLSWLWHLQKSAQ